MVEILRIEHVSINVIDIEKSKHFYSNVMGFRHLETVERGDHKVIYYEIPGGSRLELFDYSGKNPVVPHGDSDSGLRHLAFTVKNVSDHEHLLREVGVEITLPTTELPDLGVRVLLFRDPNGVTLEFCEPL